MSNAAGVRESSILIPIVLGITGHRDLRAEDIPELEKKLCLIFSELKNSYPHSPLILLSPLAEGADRLAARSALNCGVRLVVPLPMSKEEYEKDFITPQSLAEFNNLLGEAENAFELPPLENFNEERDHKYAKVGAYIVQYSHILIAMWDGMDTDLTGGTAQIVRFKLNGVPEPYAPPQNILDPVDTGPVFHIVTPRVKNPSPAGDVFSINKYFPGGSNIEGKPEEALAGILESIEGFNRDAGELALDLKSKIEASRVQLIPKGVEGMLGKKAKAILERFALADSLAVHFQEKRVSTLVNLFILAVIAFFFFELYAHLIQESFMIALYPATLLLASILYIWVKKHGYENKHLDYRALAEGLRIQLFWKLTGLREDVTRYYLRKQKSELDWVRKGIETFNISVPGAGGAEGSGEKAFWLSNCRLTLDHWVLDQRKYYKKTSSRDHSKLKRQETMVYGFFLAGLAIAILVFFLDISSSHTDSLKLIHHILIVAMGLAPALAAALDGYAEKMAFAAQNKVYKRMYNLFDRASVQLRSMWENSDLDCARSLIRELGREALQENSDWVLLHRERPMKIPMGG
ncbi:hypothetical protein ACOBQJ_15680 [Pelotomaculum propionicicum]|uniref:hypothetical protein n=1 Tax=Pelotomaculum propionicicum TaxID=258475 RepID=UPI003B7DF1BC